MKVFVTGATGYIGSAVCEKLVASGHAVSGLARSDSAAQRLARMGLGVHRGDLGNLASVRGGAAAADAVVHIAYSTERITAEQAVINALLDELTGSGKRLVMASGTGVLPDTGDRAFTEETTFDPPDFAAARTEAEREVLASAGRGVRGTVIRPSLVFGRGGSVFLTTMIAAARREGHATYVGDGSNRRSVVHVDDLANLFTLAVAAEDEGGELYYAEAGEPLAARALAEGIATAAGVPEQTRSLTPAEAAAVWGPFATSVAANNVVVAHKARRQFGWRPLGPSLLDDLTQGSYATPA